MTSTGMCVSITPPESVHPNQWRIYIQKFPACTPPPNRTKFFRFYICIHRKVCQRLAPPPMRVGAPPNMKSWIRPCKLMGTYKKSNIGVYTFINFTNIQTLIKVLPNFTPIEITNLREQLYSITICTHVHCCTSFHYHYWVLVHPKSCRQLYSFH